MRFKAHFFMVILLFCENQKRKTAEKEIAKVSLSFAQKRKTKISLLVLIDLINIAGCDDA